MGSPGQAVQWVLLDGAGADATLGALWVPGQGQEAVGAWRGFSHTLAGIFYPGSQAEISLQTDTKAASLSPHQAGGWCRLRWAQLQAV